MQGGAACFASTAGLSTESATERSEADAKRCRSSVKSWRDTADGSAELNPIDGADSLRVGGFAAPHRQAPPTSTLPGSNLTQAMPLIAFIACCPFEVTWPAARTPSGGLGPLKMRTSLQIASKIN